MDINFIMAPQKKNQNGEYYVDLLIGGPTHENRPTLPHIKNRYFNAHQRAKKGNCYVYQEEKSQYDDQISDPSSTHVNATFTGN